jgi:hypothetical protein
MDTPEIVENIPAIALIGLYDPAEENEHADCQHYEHNHRKYHPDLYRRVQHHDRND